MRLSDRTLNTLAEMICGDSWDDFQYRTGSQLSKFFFADCGLLDYVHDGSTRQSWVLQVLEDLNQPTASDGALPSDALRKVIQELLDPTEFARGNRDREAALKNLNIALARDGLEAYFDARQRCLVRRIAFEAGVAAPSRSLRQVLRDRDMGSVHDEFERALSNVESDPPAAATAACALLEAVFKVYVESHDLTLPKKPTAKPLWNVVAANLGFTPGRIEDDDLKRILSGMSSVVDGIAALRTHAGSAHGRGTMRYNLKPRHARLAVHSAHTLAIFVVESWYEKTAPE